MKSERLESKDKYHALYLIEKINNLKNQLNIFNQEKLALELSIKKRITDDDNEPMLISLDNEMVYTGTEQEITELREKLNNDSNNISSNDTNE